MSKEFILRGKILDFNHFNNSGNLISDDGNQYVFSGDTWKEQPSPKNGDIIVTPYGRIVVTPK